MKQYKKYVICLAVSCVAELLGLSSFASGSVVSAFAFPLLILFGMSAWETKVFTWREDRDHGFLRGNAPYWIQQGILTAANVVLRLVLRATERVWNAFIIVNLAIPILILLVFALKNMKFRRFIIGGAVFFIVQGFALFWSFSALFDGNSAYYITVLFFGVIISAFELKLYEKKQHQMREFFRESVPFLIQTGIIIVLDLCFFAYFYAKMMMEDGMFGAIILALLMPVYVMLLLNTGIVYLIAAVRRKKAEFFVVGGLGMLAAHSSILFLFEYASFLIRYAICAAVVIGVALWEMELFHRWPVSVRVFLHEMLPCLLQAVIILAADALFCTMQYLIRNQWVTYINDNWAEAADGIEEIGIVTGKDIFFGLIPCTAIQVIALLVVFAVGMERTVTHRSKKR